MTENEQKRLEQDQLLKYSKNIQITNAKKEKEKQKRQNKIVYKQAKFLLYDEIMQNIDFDKDINAILYNINLRDNIITKVINDLFYKILKYKYVSDELQEDINLYLLEIYNTTARQSITIKSKEKKELERIEKEKQKEEYKKKLLLQYEEIEKEKEKQKELEQIKVEQEKKENVFAWICTIIFLLIIAIIIWNTKILGI